MGATAILGPVTTSLSESFAGTVDTTSGGVDLSGEVHVLSHVTFLSDGSVRLDVHTNVRGKGVGASGESYTVTGAGATQIIEESDLKEAEVKGWAKVFSVVAAVVVVVNLKLSLSFSGANPGRFTGISVTGIEPCVDCVP